MWDERLTTVEADRTLIEAGVRRENRDSILDGIAAVFIAGIFRFPVSMTKVTTWKKSDFSLLMEQ